MQKLQKYRAWFGACRAMMATLAIMLMTAFPASATRTQTAPASQQTITRSMTGAPDDVGWRQTMTNGVKSNLNNSYDVDKVDVNFQVVNQVYKGDLPAALIGDHPRATAYVPYSYTLEMNPFKFEEVEEMSQLASAERSWCPSIRYGKPRMNFSANAKRTANVERLPQKATMTRRE